MYIERRNRLFEKLQDGEVVIGLAANKSYRNNDVTYPFRQNSDFHYLTGFGEADAVLVMRHHRGCDQTILFCHPKDPEIEMWDGTRLGVDAAPGVLQVDQAYALTDLKSLLPECLLAFKTYYCDHPDWLLATLPDLDDKKQIHPLGPSLSDLRLIKSDDELDLMQKAADISVKAHERAMRVCRPGMFEYELEAELRYDFCRHGARSSAYESIVAGGANACTLHYVKNNARIEAGDLVLIDAGAEWEHYASDITRTFPANGRFSSAQKIIYEIVLKAQQAVIDQIKPGLPWPELQKIADQVLVEGLVKCGILRGKVKALLANKAYKSFSKHGVGHWLGLDVHDVGPYEVNHKPIKLQENMAFTVEPGLYIDPNRLDVDERFWGIGIRIEDDVVVTNDGCRILTEKLPKTINEIEQLMVD